MKKTNCEKRIGGIVTKCISLLILGLVLVLPAFGENTSEPVQVFFSFNDDDSVPAFLKATKSVERSGNMFFVRKDFSADSLEKILTYYQLSADVAMSNIENEKTTRTAVGGPFQRQVVHITPEGVISVEHIDGSNPRLEYDPIHPDAIKSGPKKGYVEYPNINIDEELKALRYLTSAFNVFVAIGQALNTHFVVEKIAFGDYVNLLQLRELKTQNDISRTRMNLELKK